MPRFVDPSNGAAWVQVGVLGTCFVALAVLTDSAYALAASATGRLIRSSARAPGWLRRASGATYLGLGAAAALSGERARN